MVSNEINAKKKTKTRKGIDSGSRTDALAEKLKNLVNELQSVSENLDSFLSHIEGEDVNRVPAEGRIIRNANNPGKKQEKSDGDSE